MGTRPLKNLSEVIVIGGGLAGLSAARHMARLGRLVTLFEGSGLWGGQVATLGHVDGLPLPGHFSGQDLAIPMMEDLRKVGVRVVEWPVESVTCDEVLLVRDGSGEVHRPEAVIVASGATLRPLRVPGEEQFLGRGVSRCATCDGGFYKGREVAVIGGGDGAVHEALTLAPLASRVHLVCRSPLSARREYADRIAAKDNVSFVWDSEVVEVLGDNAVTGLRLRDVRDGAGSELAVAGVFPFIGVEPVSGFLPERLRTASGHVAAGPDTRTADPRLFAAGAVRAGHGGTGIEAMAEGVRAAEAAARLLARRF